MGSPVQHPSSISHGKTHYKRRPLSCLACRQHKLKCDRQVPCSSCVYAHREDHCRNNPPSPATQKLARNESPRFRFINLGPRNTAELNHDEGKQPNSIVENDGRTGHQESLLKHDNAGLLQLSMSSTTTIKKARTVGDNQIEKMREKMLLQSSSSSGPDPATAPYIPLLLPFGSLPQSFLPGNSDSSLALASNANTACNQQKVWKSHLCGLLPTQGQCEMLICYYFENANWLQSVHAPTFRQEFAQFWNTDIDDVDLIWLSLLFTIISSSALYIPVGMSRVMGFQTSRLRQLAHLWHSASRQALHAGYYEARPCLTQLLTFCVTQIYWTATNDVNTHSSCLGQAIRTAQALGLDRDIRPAINLEIELRHRIWWDLCSADSVLSVYFGKTPTINCSKSKVPEPLNCNDIDLMGASVNQRPMEEPTEMSLMVVRAKLSKIISKLYADDGESAKSYKFVQTIDNEIMQTVAKFPWYFRVKDGDCVDFPEELVFLSWQLNVLQTFICTQRIRMYCSFLHNSAESWNICMNAAEDALVVYNKIRNKAGSSFTESPKFLVQIHRVFQVGISLAMLLMLERGHTRQGACIRRNLENLISDLAALDSRTINVRVAGEGNIILQRMLAIHDRKELGNVSDQEDLIRVVSSLMGGEHRVRTYFKRQIVRTVVADADDQTNPKLDVLGPKSSPDRSYSEHSDLEPCVEDAESQDYAQEMADYLDMGLDLDLQQDIFTWSQPDSSISFWSLPHEEPRNL